MTPEELQVLLDSYSSIPGSLTLRDAKSAAACLRKLIEENAELRERVGRADAGKQRDSMQTSIAAMIEDPGRGRA